MSDQPTNILLVEDNPGHAKLIQAMLSQRPTAGFAIEIADRLSAGLAYLAEAGADLILLDLDLPDSKGLDTLKRMHAGAQGIPIIVLTGLKDETTGILAVQEGAQDYLIKGVDAPLLTRSIQYAIARNRAEEAEHEQRTIAETLAATAAAINKSLDLNQVLDQILVFIERVFPYDTATIMLIESESARVVQARGYAERGLGGEVLKVNLPVNDILTLRRMVESRKPLIIPDVSAYPEWVEILDNRWIRSYAGVPIREKTGNVIGFINLDSESVGGFNLAHDEQLQAFADQAGIAIQNAQLYEKTRRYAALMEQRVEERTADLNQAKERVEAILNNSSDAIILTYVDGAVRVTNPALNDLFGYDQDAIFQQPLSKLFAPEGGELLKETVKALGEDKQSRRIEAVARRSDGALFDADVALSIIPESQQHAAGFVCIVRDITERKQIEASLRKALEKERELNELKTRFVSMASHEFRTPLAIIQATSDALRNYIDRMDETQKAIRFDKIQDQIQRMTSLMDDVLTIGRIEAGIIEFNPVKLDLNQFCQEIVAEFLSLADTTHEVVYSSESQCPELLVDKKLMQQIVSNLISNAIKYSPPESTVWVDLACEDTKAVLRVADEGIGIPEKDQALLFQAFHRAANVGAAAGTGLGLAITKNAVEMHNGRITFETRIDEGTTFIVTIPTT